MTSLYDPLLYALVHTGTPGDLAFYVAQCEGAGRVVELGAGFGRIASELAAAGHEVAGLDIHDGLLALAERARAELPPEAQSRLELLHADMRDFQLEGRFERVIIPHSGLYCLLEDADVERCLACVRRHLVPGGRLIFDAYAADGFHDETEPDDHPDDQLDEVALIACEGTVYDVYERSHWDKATQRMLATYVYVPDDGAAPREFAIDQRYLLRAQVERLLEGAGFEIRQLSGDFAGSEYDADSEQLVVVATVRD